MKQKLQLKLNLQKGQIWNLKKTNLIYPEIEQILKYQNHGHH